MMGINEYLSQFQNETVYYKPNPGNGGDALIALGAFVLFKQNKITFKILKNKDQVPVNSILFYAGGGNFIDEYDNCAKFIKENHINAKKLIVLPHTIKGNLQLLQSLGKNVDIICREKKSFKYVSEFKNINNVYLFDDLAFSLDIKAILDNYSFDKSNLNLLFRVYGKKVLLDKKLDFKVLNAFRVDVEKTDIEIPKDNIDVSNTINYNTSMDDIVLVEKTVSYIFNFVNRFNTINTNRLHIAITAALLNKKVNFYPNSYWKNEAIYEQSIKNKFPNVKWMK